jgi:hypothetical protein
MTTAVAEKPTKTAEPQGAPAAEAAEPKVPYWRTEKGRAAAKKYRDSHPEAMREMARRYRQSHGAAALTPEAHEKQLKSWREQGAKYRARKAARQQEQAGESPEAAVPKRAKTAKPKATKKGERKTQRQPGIKA